MNLPLSLFRIGSRYFNHWS